MLPYGITRGVAGSNISFICISEEHNQNSIRWIIHCGEPASCENIIVTEHDPGIGTLEFIFLTLQNNASMIRCAVYNTTTLQVSSVSNEVMLLVSQGLQVLLWRVRCYFFYCLGQLSAVGSLKVALQNSTLIVTWTAPSVIGILDHEPNMTTYCIEVDSSSSLSELHSECEINATMFIFTLPPKIFCQRLTFIVTPQSVAGYGPSRAQSFVVTVASKAVV